MFKSLGLLTLAATAKLASSHATIFNAHINDIDQGRGDSAAGYIRAPPNNSPLVDVTSKDMICNVNNFPVAKTLSVKAGDKFSFEWHHNTAGPEDDIIDPSHQGPVLVYIAPTTEGTAGNGWVKIYEDGFDGSFAVDKLIKNRGIHSIIIPDIPAGEYLLRAEIIALHEGFFLNGAQFYPGCIQIEITSSGTTPLPSGSTIPGIYSANDPGILFDLYNGVTSYTIPGPPVWDGTSSGTDPVPPTAPTPTTLQTSVIPATTLTTSTTSAPSTDSPPPATSSTAPPTGGVIVGEWLQCGGLEYVGPTTCAAGLTCKEWNPYYAQCVSPSIL